MSIDTGVALVIVRCIMLLAIFIRLATYRDQTARHRAFVSVMATCAAGTSLAWAFHSMIMLQHGAMPDARAEFWPAMFVLCALIPIFYARGNVAKLLPRVKWLHH